MATPEELAAAYAASWPERDAARRTALLESCCSPGVRFLQEADDEVVDRGYGTDVVELADDGRMRTIVVFGDPGPPPGGAS